MKYEDAMAILEADLKRLRSGSETHSERWIDWYKLFSRESQANWIVEDVWPAERQVHLHAAPKTGKSLLSLWIACSLATGHDPFSGREQKRVKVAYLDYEMTEDDLLERVEQMGFTPDQLDGFLFYALHPQIPALDTQAGGQTLVEWLSQESCTAVVIDTFARVVLGDENSNDTYRHFYKWTGSLLKAAGIALLRLDHEGHLEGRSRGASAKADDVDVVFQLKRTDGGFQLVRKSSRLSWIPESVSIRETDPYGFTRSSFAVPEGTLDKVRELDAANVPEDASRRIAAKMLKEQGISVGNTTVLNAAQQYRKHRILGT